MKHILLLILLGLPLNVLAQKRVRSDTIAFRMNAQNNLFVKAVFNHGDTLNLNFDTGTTELILINSVLKSRLKTVPRLYDTLYDLQIGQTMYSTKVYDAELSAQETDGRFGWDLFKSKVVELDYDKNIFVVHSKLPEGVANNKAYTKLALEFAQDLLLIKGSIEQNGVTNEDLFLVDTGYQRTVMLDNDLLKQGGFPADKMAVIKKVIMKGAQGNEIPVLTSNLGVLTIGRYKLTNVPVQQVTTNKPLKTKNIHILGNDVLKRFNTIFDWPHKVVYLKPNHLYPVAFTDQVKKGE